MSMGTGNRDDDRLDMAQLSDAALIRAAADDEPGARAELQRRGISDSDAQIVFESSLRDAVGRAMSGSTAPAALRAQVIAMMHRERDEHPHAESMSFVEAKARHEAHAKPRDAHHKWMGSGLRRGVAIAAVVALGAGATWMGVQNSQSINGNTLITENASFLNTLSFIRQEHDSRATFDDQYRATFTVKIEEALDLAEHELGSMPTCLEKAIRGCTDSGLVFAGLSSCSMPDDSGAVHVMYWSVPDESTVSMFIISDLEGATETECPTKALEVGTSYVCSESQESGSPLQVWRRGDFTFYLASGHTEPVPVVRKLHEAPIREEMLGSL